MNKVALYIVTNCSPKNRRELQNERIFPNIQNIVPESELAENPVIKKHVALGNLFVTKYEAKPGDPFAVVSEVEKPVATKTTRKSTKKKTTTSVDDK